MECIIDGIFRNGARRVVIPGVGAFVRKDSGEIIFSDLLRADDGMLAACWAQREGITLAQAQERTREYAERIRLELTRSGRVDFPGWGTLRRAEDGFCTFEPFLPQAEERPIVRDAAVAAAEEACCDEEQTEEDIVEAAVEMTVSVATEPVPEPAQEPEGESEPEVQEAPSAAAPAAGQPAAENPAPAEETAHNQPASAEPHVSRTGGRRLRSVLYESDEAEEGHADASEPAAAGQTAESAQTSYRPEIHIRRPNRPRKRADVVLVIAVIALVITIGVLVYGYFAKRDIAAMHEQELVLEMTADPAAADQPEAGE